MAIVSLGGLYQLNTKLENDAVEQSVKRLSLAAEESYSCWDAGICRHDNELIGGWNSDRTIYNTELGLGSGSLSSFSADLDVTDANGKTNNLIITASNVKSDIGRRVARELGTAAEYKDNGNGDSGQVEFKVGIPGTEFALRGVIEKAVVSAIEKIQTQDLEFGPADPDDEDEAIRKNIMGAGDVDAQTITIDGVEIDKDLALSVHSIKGKKCPNGVAFDDNSFSCAPPMVFCTMSNRTMRPAGGMIRWSHGRCRSCSNGGMIGWTEERCLSSGDVVRSIGADSCRSCSSSRPSCVWKGPLYGHPKC